jgi:hypothetical protein
VAEPFYDLWGWLSHSQFYFFFYFFRLAFKDGRQGSFIFLLQAKQQNEEKITLVWALVRGVAVAALHHH